MTAQRGTNARDHDRKGTTNFLRNRHYLVTTALWGIGLNSYTFLDIMNFSLAHQDCGLQEMTQEKGYRKELIIPKPNNY